MAAQTNFTPEQWNRSLESVMLWGIGGEHADPSGLIGVHKEAMTTERTVLQAKSDPSPNELIKAVVLDFEHGEGRETARTQLQSHQNAVAIGRSTTKPLARCASCCG